MLMENRMDEQMDIINMSPYFKEEIWGGSKMRSEFGYDIPSDKPVNAGLSVHIRTVREKLRTENMRVYICRSFGISIENSSAT